MSNPKISERLGLVVVNYGSHALLERYLSVQFIPRGAHVVVVDNFYSDNELTSVRSLAHRERWHLEEVRPNGGFGSGVNRGVDRALTLGCTSILLLNPDASIEESHLTTLLESLDREPGAMLSPRIDRPDGTIWFAGGALDFATGEAYHPKAAGFEPLSWLSGACILMSSETWRLSGGFEEQYFLYWEDADLTYRWKRAGGMLAVVTSAVARHDVGGTQSGSRKSAAYLRFNARNRLLFAGRNLSILRGLLWVVTSPRYAALLFLRAQGHKDRRFISVASPVFWGTLAGVASWIHQVTRRIQHFARVKYGSFLRN